MSQKTQRQVMPAMQRINQGTDQIIQELSWIKENSPSVKAKNHAGKAILSFETGELYAEKAIILHDLKETQSEGSEQGTTQQSQRSSRFQGQQS